MSSKSDLPSGWEWARLGELGRYVNGRAFKPSDWKSKGGPIIRIQNLTGSTNKINYFDGEVDEENIIQSGDFLISWSATLDAFIWKGGEAVLNQHIFKVYPLIDKKFLFYCVKNFLRELTAKVHGTGMQHITKGRFDETLVPVAPMSEQRRIVSKIEVLFRESKSASEALDKIPEIMKKFKQSIIFMASLGNLTKNWREKNKNVKSAHAILSKITQGETLDSLNYEKLPEIPDTWEWTVLRIVADIRGGITKGKNYKGKKTIQLPYLRVANVQDGYLDLAEIKKIEALPEDLERYRLRKGDVLFNEGGDRDKLGRGCVWNDEIKGCIHQNHVFRARLVSKEILPEYLTIFSKSDFARQYFFAEASQTVNLASLNMTALGNLPVAIPPLEEQLEIVKIVEQNSKFVSQIEKSVEEAKNHADRIDQAILTKAFRGELVPQDPNDESASVLLEKIRNETRQKLELRQKSKQPKSEISNY